MRLGELGGEGGQVALAAHDARESGHDHDGQQAGQRKLLPLDLTDYAYAERENVWKPDFKKIPVSAAAGLTADVYEIRISVIGLAGAAP